ncbi:MAG: ABC transporter permease subunit, partial [Bacteroidales bacterium]|nr:ABC transporter permease subunit [Bacteroidales bacterium]
MNKEHEQVRFSRFNDFLRKFKRQKTAIFALFVIFCLMLIAIFCYKIAPYGINEFDYTAVLQGPSAKHWFGTDEFGRDLFSRILCGTRISLLVGICSVTVGAVTGTVLGLIAGYYGGPAESVIMRLCDVLFAFPGIVLAIAVIAVLGSGIQNVVIAVAVFSMPTFCRLVRSSVLATKESVYVQAERSLGAP